MSIYPITAQANFSVSGAVDVVVNAAAEAVAWIGRAVVYLKDFVVDYALKAWQLGGVFFTAATNVVAQNAAVFTAIGLTASVVAIGYVLSRLAGQESCKKPAGSESMRSPILLV